jgi:hypothetical protein
MFIHHTPVTYVCRARISVAVDIAFFFCMYARQTQQQLQALSAAVVIFGGLYLAAENKPVFSAAFSSRRK